MWTYHTRISKEKNTGNPAGCSGIKLCNCFMNNLTTLGVARCDQLCVRALGLCGPDLACPVLCVWSQLP
jgi:hypothetical protein